MDRRSRQREIYNDTFDGLSYYPTTGEVYHTNRSKAKFHKFYLEAIQCNPKPKVLDIGCHVGTELFMLPKPNPYVSYWGIDISDSTIGIANAFSKKRGEKNMHFKVIDADKALPFPNKSFDVIYALELIEHLKNPGEFFRNIRKLLKDKGSLIISTPNAGTFSNILINLLPSFIKRPIIESRHLDFTRHGYNSVISPDVWDKEAHISLWDFNKWKSVINKCGFKIDKVEGSSFFGGSRFISDRPALLGLVILLDSFIDLLPIKPHFQMCMLIKVSKK